MLNPHRIAINQATTRVQWNFRQSVEGYAQHGVRGIAIWRDKLSQVELGETKRILAGNGMWVSGLNRTGPFTSLSGLSRTTTFDDGRRAVDEAAELAAACLLIFPGGLCRTLRISRPHADNWARSSPSSCPWLGVPAWFSARSD